MPNVKPDSEQTRSLLDRLDGGDRNALDQLLARYQPELESFIDFHLDAALRGRLDPLDVVQEAQLEVVRRMDDYLRRRPMPFHLWARKTAYERLQNLRRDHRQRARRSVDREVPPPERSSLAGSERGRRLPWTRPAMPTWQAVPPRLTSPRLPELSKPFTADPRTRWPGMSSCPSSTPPARPWFTRPTWAAAAVMTPPASPWTLPAMPP